MLGSLGITNYSDSKKKPAFGNNLLVSVLGSDKLTAGFNFLETHQSIKVAGLDLTTMVGPRTVMDWNQNPDYGKETAFRESSAMAVNPFMPGVLGMAMMSLHGYDGLYVNSKTLNTLHEAWKKADPDKNFDIKNPQNEFEKVKKYFSNIFENARGKLEDETRSLKEILGEKSFDEFTEDLAKAALGDKKTKKSLLQKASETITNATKSADVELGKDIDTSVDNLLRDSVATLKKIFIKTLPEKLDDTVNNLGGFLKRKSLIAVGATVATGFMLQYINSGITKMRTGCSEFPGYRDFGDKKSSEQDKKKNKIRFVIKKGLAAAGIMSMTLATMGAFGKKGFFKPGNWKQGFNNFKDAIELRDAFAHLNVIKLVYGSVISGRFLAARDETEVNTGMARDYTGFLNWLVLGPFVAKGVAQAVDPTLLNGSLKGDNWLRKGISWLTDKSLKTNSEAKAMWSGPALKRKMATLNGANLAGIGYSMFALGIGMPYLINKYIINKSGSEKQERLGNHKLFAAFLDKRKDNYGEIYKGLIANG